MRFEGSVGALTDQRVVAVPCCIVVDPDGVGAGLLWVAGVFVGFDMLKGM